MRQLVVEGRGHNLVALFLDGVSTNHLSGQTLAFSAEAADMAGGVEPN
jgi:hypothetical protein